MRHYLDNFHRYCQEVWQYRHFWLSLVRLDIRTRYRGSFLGLGWSMLRPIGMTAVICAVFATLFNKSFTEYAPMLLIGLTFWGFVTEAILGGCLSFHQSEGYIRQIRLPLAIFPLRVVLVASFHFIVCLPVALLAVILTTGIPGPGAIAAVCFSLVALLVLGWALAVLGGLVTVYFPDMKYILEILLQIVFYMTPIIYPASFLRERRFGSFLLDVNPFSYFLEQIRQPLLEGSLVSLTMYGVSIAIVVGFVVVAVAALGWLERRLIFWL